MPLREKIKLGELLDEAKTCQQEANKQFDRKCSGSAFHYQSLAIDKLLQVVTCLLARYEE